MIVGVALTQRVLRRNVDWEIDEVRFSAQAEEVSMDPGVLHASRDDRAFDENVIRRAKGTGDPPNFELARVDAESRARLKAVWSDLADRALRQLGLVRWRFQIEEEPMTEGHTNYVKLADGEMLYADDGLVTKVEFLVRLRPDVETVKAMATIGARAPLGHDILHEARARVKEGATRAGVTLAATAVEVGLKGFLAERFEELSEFMADIPSPPVKKILRSLAHVQSARPGERVVCPDAMVSAAHKLSELRNKVVHRGGLPSESEAERSTDVASSVLYWLDFHSGHDWAVSKVLEEFRPK